MTDTGPVTKGDLINENVEKVFPEGVRETEQQSTELTVVAQRPGGTIMASDLDAAKMMAMAGPFVPEFIRGNPGQCLALIQLSRRWSRYDQRTNSWITFDPIAIAQCSYLVKSEKGGESVGFTSQFVGAIIDAFVPFAERMRYVYQGEGQERTCTAFAKLRSDPQPFSYTTPPLKTITPKKSPLWQSDPDRQLAYYARRAWARLFASGALLGVYDVEELEGEATQNQRVHAVKDLAHVEGLAERLERARLAAQGEAQEGYREGVVEQGLGEPGSGGGHPEKHWPHLVEKPARPARKRPARAVERAKAPKATRAAPKAEKSPTPSRKASKPAAKAEPSPQPAPLPKEPDQYERHVQTWLATLHTEEAIEARWRADMKLRNACGVVEEQRYAIRLMVDQRIADLRAGETQL